MLIRFFQPLETGVALSLDALCPLATSASEILIGVRSHKLRTDSDTLCVLYWHSSWRLLIASHMALLKDDCECIGILQSVLEIRSCLHSMHLADGW